MNAIQTEQPLQIGQEKMLAFVRSMLGVSVGREDEDHPLHPGPWDPVIRLALERSKVSGPSPEPWKLVLESILTRHPGIYDAIGGSHKRGEEVALNPQPLPPRLAFLIALARVVTNRAELLQEIANATSHESERQGIIIVGGYTTRFSEDWCGNGFRLKYPLPGPRPHWFNHELDAIDLMVIATQFDQAAKEAFSPNLRQHLANAGTRFVKAGLLKMQ